MLKLLRRCSVLVKHFVTKWAALAVAGAEQILAREVDKTVHAAMLE